MESYSKNKPKRKILIYYYYSFEIIGNKKKKKRIIVFTRKIKLTIDLSHNPYS